MFRAMKIATWNVNSIRQREKHVANWLARCQPDVLMLQEIKCEATAFPALTFHGLGYQTDAVGQFVVRGNFAGPATMVFDLPGGGQASLIVVVPRGGELTLSNVRIDARTGKATADSQRVRFGDSWTARTVRETRPRW